MKKPPTTAPAWPEVNFSEEGDVRFLHLGTPWVQGSMSRKAPYDLELEYVQRMMAGLLFMDLAELPHKQAMQLGLGAAALTKFCYKKLRMHTTAIEINPQVVAACRLWFKLPPDDQRLRIVLADAAVAMGQTHYQGQMDLLHVDLYDHEAAAPVLDSVAFYQDCRSALTPEGVMTVNLFGRDSTYADSLLAITQAFGAEAVWAFAPTREGNTVVLAQRNPSRPVREALVQQADTIAARWGLPAPQWLRVLKPVVAAKAAGQAGSVSATRA